MRLPSAFIFPSTFFRYDIWGAQCPTEVSTPLADELLQSALLHFPTVLHHLLDKCSVATDPRVEKHPHFALTKEYALPRPLNQLVSLYTAR